jgi:hypothetical protein
MIRARLKIWMLETMKRENWSVERWANEAGVSGSTLTEFLNSDDPARLLSCRTLEKLARAAGDDPAG